MRNSDGGGEDPNKFSFSSPLSLDSRFSQTLRNVQGLLKGRSFPGKVLLTRRSDPLEQSVSPSANNDRRFSDSDVDHGEQADRMTEDDLRNITSRNAMSSVNHANSSTTGSENIAKEIEDPNGC
ncbi:UNVERIFIED_CONTAM: hypothetical protein Sangu_1159100 [Sesamum angustifolium]|uniref:Uncharacterized protein n=1 Tax=Sesamum angustifolium TaxID=2727405 RepID=A0AAW2P2L7_9LAMI